MMAPREVNGIKTKNALISVSFDSMGKKMQFFHYQWPTYLTNFFLLDSINYAAFSYVGITNNSDRNALLIAVKLCKLSEEIDQCPFAKAVCQGSMKG
jgi:hypothetical protein